MYAPNLLIDAVVVAIIALMTWATLDFDPKYLGTPAFWIVSIILFVLYTAIHWSLFDSKLRSLKANKENQEYIAKQKAKIETATGLVVWREYASEFVGQRNAFWKIEAWKTHVRNKITKLSSHARKADKDVENAVVSTFQKTVYKEFPDKIKALQDEIDRTQSENRYCQRKRAFENMLTDQWIADNINKISIDYNEIDVQYVETGNIIKGVQKDKQVAQGTYWRDNAGSRLFWFVVTSAITAIGIDSFTAGLNLDALLVFCFRMFGVLINVILAIRYAEEFYQKIDVWNIDKRAEISSEFKTWGLKQGFMTANR